MTALAYDFLESGARESCETLLDDLKEMEEHMREIEEKKMLFLEEYGDTNWGQLELDSLKDQNLAFYR